MRAKLNELRSDSIISKISDLQINLTSDLGKLKRLQQKHALNLTSKGDWSGSYRLWNNWEDEDELQDHIDETRKKLLKLQSTIGSNRKQSGNRSCCPSSCHRHSERIVAKMNLPERLQKMKTFRQLQGNRCFNKGDFDSALKWYEKSLMYYEYCLPKTKEEKQALDKERELSLINSAACHMGLNRYRQCIDCCTEALEVSRGNNIKALYRRAKAYRSICDFEKATNDLKNANRVLALTFSMSGKSEATEGFRLTLQEEQQCLQAAIFHYRESSRNVAKKMMQSSS